MWLNRVKTTQTVEDKMFGAPSIQKYIVRSPVRFQKLVSQDWCSLIQQSHQCNSQDVFWLTTSSTENSASWCLICFGERALDFGERALDAKAVAYCAQI